MKRSLFIAANFVLILALVLSFGIAGCTGTEETTPASSAPASTTPPPSSTTPPPETTTPPPETTTPPPEPTTTTPPPEETTTPPPEETTTPPPEETTTPPEETTTPPEETTTPAAGTTVYVSVSVDGELLVAAQPVTVTDLNVEAVILAAHAEFYSGGESGYTAGIDPTWGMYLISQCWGVANTPYIIINNAPLQTIVNTTPVVANDNIIICTGADTTTISPVSLTATVSDDSVTVTAKAWTLNMATFAYSSAPLAGANVIDPTTGESLGTTDENGQITVTVPESGIVAIEGMAAINVEASST